jgi:hypothetical protein
MEGSRVRSVRRRRRSRCPSSAYTEPITLPADGCEPGLRPWLTESPTQPLPVPPPPAVHELGARIAAGRAMAYARLHMASTLLVLAAILLVPVTTGGSVDGLFLVAWSYVAVQVGCA